jgi:hypothetical protein
MLLVGQELALILLHRLGNQESGTLLPVLVEMAQIEGAFLSEEEAEA